jgi:anti-sigma regulatory factor (Ser/Thr protein kinase)
LISRTSRTLTVRADLAEVDRVRLFLRDSLGGVAVAEEEAMKIELSLHEIFVNVAMYAFPQGDGEASLRTWIDQGTFYVEIRDRGIPFDPADRPTPDLEEKIRRGTRGGLGVFLFKTLMDGFSYQRNDGENVLKIFKKL